MRDASVSKVVSAKTILETYGFIFKEFPNGQLQVGTVNFWATSEKWYDTATGQKGKGLNSFIAYIEGVRDRVRDQAYRSYDSAENKENAVDVGDKSTNDKIIDSAVSENVTEDDDDLPWD